MNLTLIWLFVAMENIAITVCVTYAAIRFNKWSLLWFLVLVLLNGVSTRTKSQDEDKKQK